MWQGFMIALREGLESFLIVALILSYLRRTGRDRLARAVAAGVVTSLFVCAGAGYLLSQAANHALWEGILAGVSAVLVGSFLIYMVRGAKTLKHDMEARLARATAADRGFWASFGGVFLF